jgi:hypothetical protein
MGKHAPLVIAQGTEVRGFLIESELGAGGFGPVFRASRGQRRYALKFIRRKDAGGWARREVEMLLRCTPEYRAPEAWRFLRDRARPLGTRDQPGPADDLMRTGSHPGTSARASVRPLGTPSMCTRPRTGAW